jgi:hypothetical protein
MKKKETILCWKCRGTGVVALAEGIFVKCDNCNKKEKLRKNENPTECLCRDIKTGKPLSKSCPICKKEKQYWKDFKKAQKEYGK